VECCDKQNDFVISRGMLGDAMKQILALGYVLIHLDDDRNEFTDRQWEHPLIIRHNKKEGKYCCMLTKLKKPQTYRNRDRSRIAINRRFRFL